LYYTAYGIITPVGVRPVHGLREDLNYSIERPTSSYVANLTRVLSQPVHGTATYRCCIIQFLPPDDEHIVLETCRGI